VQPVAQGVALQNYLNTTLHGRPIEKMAKPLGIVSTDLHSGAVPAGVANRVRGGAIRNPYRRE